ncbi:MAG: response regulator transcription factor [Spirochaetia bacterium]|nr:response regulator transcription factor [Spirochaetia bacterium]
MRRIQNRKKKKNHTSRIVHDEQKIANMVYDYLDAVGFSVETAADGRAALLQIADREPDLVLLDVMMPGLDGLDVVRKVRSESNIPVILLTARAEEQDKLIGLELGADDYITKPFSMKELAARIRTVLRRSKPLSNASDGNSQKVIKHGPLQVDIEKRRRRWRCISTTTGVAISISRTPQYPGKIFTRMMPKRNNMMLQGYERTIDVHIKNIRKALEPDSSNPIFIFAETDGSGGINRPESELV